VDGPVDLLGEGVEELLAALEVLLGVAGLWQGEGVAGFEVAPPAAQPFKTVLFLFELGQGELAEPLLLASSASYLSQSATNSAHSSCRALVNSAASNAPVASSCGSACRTRTLPSARRASSPARPIPG